MTVTLLNDGEDESPEFFRLSLADGEGYAPSSPDFIDVEIADIKSVGFAESQFPAFWGNAETFAITVRPAISSAFDLQFGISAIDEDGAPHSLAESLSPTSLCDFASGICTLPLSADVNQTEFSLTPLASLAGGKILLALQNKPDDYEFGLAESEILVNRPLINFDGASLQFTEGSRSEYALISRAPNIELPAINPPQLRIAILNGEGVTDDEYALLERGADGRICQDRIARNNCAINWPDPSSADSHAGIAVFAEVDFAEEAVAQQITLSLHAENSEEGFAAGESNVFVAEIQDLTPTIIFRLGEDQSRGRRLNLRENNRKATGIGIILSHAPPFNMVVSVTVIAAEGQDPFADLEFLIDDNQGGRSAAACADLICEIPVVSGGRIGEFYARAKVDPIIENEETFTLEILQSDNPDVRFNINGGESQFTIAIIGDELPLAFTERAIEVRREQPHSSPIEIIGTKPSGGELKMRLAISSNSADSGFGPYRQNSTHVIGSNWEYMIDECGSSNGVLNGVHSCDITVDAANPALVIHGHDLRRPRRCGDDSNRPQRGQFHSGDTAADCGECGCGRHFIDGHSFRPAYRRFLRRSQTSNRPH